MNRAWAGTLLAAFVGSAGLTAAAPAKKDAGGVRWESNIDAALKKAKASGKPVMIDFWAEWCGWCHTLDRTTYRDPSVVQLSQDFVSVKVNAEGNARELEAAVEHRVESLPTILFLSSSGKIVHRVSGFQGPEEFPATMKQSLATARNVHRWEAALKQNPKDPEALRGLGIHLFDQETFGESREFLAKAVELDDALPPADRKQARMALGVIQYFDRRWKESEQALKAALAIQPPSDQDALALFALGKTYREWGKAPEAEEALKSVIERFPNTDFSTRAQELLARIDRRR